MRTLQENLNFLCFRSIGESSFGWLWVNRPWVRYGFTIIWMVEEKTFISLQYELFNNVAQPWECWWVNCDALDNYLNQSFTIPWYCRHSNGHGFQKTFPSCGRYLAIQFTYLFAEDKPLRALWWPSGTEFSIFSISFTNI